MDILSSNFEVEDLKEWGFESTDLGFNIDKLPDEKEQKESGEKVCPKCGFNF